MINEINVPSLKGGNEHSDNRRNSSHVSVPFHQIVPYKILSKIPF